MNEIQLGEPAPTECVSQVYEAVPGNLAPADLVHDLHLDLVAGTVVEAAADFLSPWLLILLLVWPLILPVPEKVTFILRGKSLVSNFGQPNYYYSQPLALHLPHY